MNLNHEQLTEVIKEAGNVDPETLAAYIEFADGQMSMAMYLRHHSEEFMGIFTKEQQLAWDRWGHRLTDKQKRRWQ